MHPFNAHKMLKHRLLIGLLLAAAHPLSAQFDTIFNLNRATGHFIKDDTIWLAAKSGVAKRLCSTGQLLATYSHQNAPIPYHQVSDVFVDAQHRMWLYLEEKGIAMLDGNQWTFWPPSDAYYVIAGGFGGRIAVDSEGVPWIGAAYRTPMCYKNGQWQLPPEIGSVSFDTRELKIGTDGKVWVVNGYGGIYRHNGTDWELVTPGTAVYSDFTLAPGGGFYACTFDNTSSEVYFYPDAGMPGQLRGTFNAHASCIAVAPTGRLWVAGLFPEGIAYFENNVWKFLPEAEQYPSGTYHLSLSVDAQGHLWDTKAFFGTRKYDGAQWQRVWTGPIGFERAVPGNDGSIWFAYLNTLSKHFPASGQTEYVYLKPQNMFNYNMVGMEPGPDGTFYAANQRGELAWYDGNGNFKQTIETFSSNFAWDAYVRMTVDQSHNLYYLGWDVFSDLRRYNAKTGQRSTIVAYHNTNPAIPFTDHYFFDADRRDRLWMNTDKGLVYWKNGAWKTFFEPGPVLDYPEFMEAGTGGIWLYSSIGQRLQYFDGKDTASWYMPLQAANGEQIFKLYSDSRNWLWCLTTQSRVLCFNGHGWDIYDSQSGTFPAFSMNNMFDDGAGNMWFLNGDDIALRHHIPSGHVRGRLFDDQNLDCSIQSGETGSGGYRIILDDGQKRIEMVADAQGRFGAAIPAGNYITSVLSLSSLGQSCQSGFEVNVAEGDSILLEIPVQTVLHTPLMSVRISTAFTRRCSETTYFVNVCNDGNLAADSVAVTVLLPEGLTFVSSATPNETDNNGLVSFYPGKVDFNDCLTFAFVAKVDCESSVELGQSLCVTAHVFPDTIPGVGPGAWLGASIVANARCTGDKVVFELKNEGKGGTLAPVKYQIIRDAYLYENGSVNLNAGAAAEYETVADGSTWRFSATQEPGHPLAPAPSVAVEGCGSGQDRSSGYIIQADNATGSAFEDTDCHEIVGSFDPNDKQARPAGWGSRHQIAPGQPLQYLIRFQNTGTDTAFTVVVRDTLDAALDWASFRPELGSHPFSVERDSAHRSVAFVFENILLPDSNRNEPASHGFVRYSIRPRPQTPLGTELRNSASIYFDFNAPVLTNTVTHIIDTGFIVPKPAPPADGSGIRIAFTPNPAGQSTFVSLDFFDAEKDHLLRIFDSQGRLLRSIDMPESPFLLEKNDLPPGVYQVSIWVDEKVIGTGLLVFGE